MSDFSEIYKQWSWNQVSERIASVKLPEVKRVLNKTTTLSWEDFLVLLSRSAADFLEIMASKSRQLTRRYFGQAIQMYIPLYLSNECQNICTYCGFSFTNKIPRLTLTDEEILKEGEHLRAQGFGHILLVTGEAQKKVGTEYLQNAIRLLHPLFDQISIEVQPLEEAEYRRLIKAGLHSVLVYQETYNSEHYPSYHPRGKKSNFEYRLLTPDRLGRSGIHKIGLGVLLGLEEWRTDSAFCGLHVDYLERVYWQSRYGISFPRLRPASGVQEPKNPVGERDLLQLICAWRIFKPQAELSISTRERAEFRDKILPLGITAMSAGSKTEPGGYVTHPGVLEQFEIDDSRSPEEVAAMLKSFKLQPVWKDWDAAMG